MWVDFFVNLYQYLDKQLGKKEKVEGPSITSRDKTRTI